MLWVKTVVVGLVAWFVLTIALGALWGVLGMSYSPGMSTFFNLVLLPVGLWIGWRFATRNRATESE